MQLFACSHVTMTNCTMTVHDDDDDDDDDADDDDDSVLP